MINKDNMNNGGLEAWALQDDAVETNDLCNYRVYEMYCDDNNGQEELEYIIERLREAYTLGGRVIKIELIELQNIDKHLNPDNSSHDFKYPNG
tara:strand:- start:1051 stop:1329 length:279 start_codon:yes stop_codon:yes gene_type:complete